MLSPVGEAFAAAQAYHLTGKSATTCISPDKMIHEVEDPAWREHDQ